MNTEGIWNHISNIRGDRVIESPEELWLLAVGYFQWNAENPLYEGKLVKYPLTAEVVAVPKMRKMSEETFYLHVGITSEHFEELAERDEFRRVCQIIKAIIYDQSLAGAAAGLLSEGIITKALGLAEKHDHTSSDGSMSTAKVDESTVDRLVAMLKGD